MSFWGVTRPFAQRMGLRVRGLVSLVCVLVWFLPRCRVRKLFPSGGLEARTPQATNQGLTPVWYHSV